MKKRILSPRVGLIIIVVIIALVGIGLFGLVRSSDSTRRGETLIANILSQVNRMSMLEWQSIAKLSVSQDLLKKVADIRNEFSQTMNILTKLHLKFKKKSQLIAAWHIYNTWMDKELHLIEAGDMDQAKTVDDEYVDPAFEDLYRILVNIELDLLSQGERARKTSILGAISLILVSGLLIGILIVKNRRGIVAVEVLRAEQRISKRSEETLQSERNKLNSVIGAMSSYLTIVDRDYTVTYQNPLSEELLGNFIGKKCYQVFGQDEKICDSCPAKLAFHDAQFHRSIRKIVKPDGKINYIELIANPIKNSYGEIVSCLEINTDITEHKLAEDALQRAHDELEQRVADRTQSLQRINEELRTEITMRKQVEAALRESEVKFRVLFEKSIHGILVVDLETDRMSYANPSICRLLGYSETEFLQLSVADIHPKDSLDRVIFEFELQRRGEKALALGLPCLRKDGTVFYADVTASPVIISDRECVMGFFSDVTERKALEDGLQKAYDDLKNLQTQLVQSGKLASIGELAAGVAHELNQPLMIIRTTAQLMLRKQRKNALDTVKLLESLNSIEKNTKRMMNIINHLRTFSRQTKTDFTLVNVNEIIQGSFLMIGEQLSLRNIEVIQDFSNDIPKVLGDANQLEQVFLNLLGNARDAVESKFEAQGGGAKLQKKIVITTHVSDDVKDKVEILFKDTGSGIPREALKNIYDPFYTTKEVGKGTGLGLSITYGIIQDHKGEIDVAETGPEGTTFRIRLPAA